MAAETPVQEMVVGLSRDVANLRPVLEAMAQLMRDSQIAQAGNEKLSYHTRQQIIKSIEDLQTWARDIEPLLQELASRTKALEDDHDGHNEDLAQILSLLRENSNHFEELLGYKVTPVPSPLSSTIHEIRGIARKLGDKDPSTGEPLEGFRIAYERVKSAFWTALGAAILALAAYKLAPHLGFKPIEQPPAIQAPVK